MTIEKSVKHLSSTCEREYVNSCNLLHRCDLLHVNDFNLSSEVITPKIILHFLKLHFIY